jgi:hypothetical protein
MEFIFVVVDSSVTAEERESLIGGADFADRIDSIFKEFKSSVQEVDEDMSDFRLHNSK